MFSGRSSWLSTLRQQQKNRTRRNRSTRRSQRVHTAAIEVLEDRTLLSNISIADATAAETSVDTTNMYFTVTRATNVAVESVDFSVVAGTATAGTDFVAYSGTVNFAAGGALTRDIAVIINGDTDVEADETYFVNIFNPGGAAAITDSQGLGTISNDDTATLTITNVTQTETNSGSTFFNFAITLNNIVDGGVTVDYATANGTATAGTDYTTTGGTLTFNGTAGEVRNVSVIVSGDLDLETDETFTVALSGITALGTGVASGDITAAGSPATGTITNDDVASLTINDVTTTETDAGTKLFVFSVTLDRAAAAAFSVDFATANVTAIAGSDYTTQNGTVNFAGAEGEVQTITVQVTGDTVIESDETFQLNLSNATGGVTIGDSQGIGTIDNDDFNIPAAPAFSAPTTAGSDAMPTFTWDAVTDATTYELLVYNISTGQAVVNETGIAATEFTPATALQQTTHQAFIRAVNNTGNGPYSFALNFDVSLGTPSLTDLAAATMDTTPTISWPAIPGASTYEILVYNANAGSLIIHQNNIATNEFTPTSPLTNATYQVFVRAVGAFGVEGSYSAAQNFDVGTVAPTFSSPSDTTGDTTPSFTWNAVAGASSYELLIYNLSAGQLVIDQTNILTNSFTPTTELAFVEHQAFVRAIDGTESPGAYSNPLEFTVSLGTPTITSPTAATTDSTPTITWDAVDGAHSYELYLYDLTAGQLISHQTDIKTTEFTTGALAQGRHQLFVRAVSNNGTGGPFTAPYEFMFTLENTTLTAPLAVSGNRTPTFVWNAVDGAAAYELLIYDVNLGRLTGRVVNIFATQFQTMSAAPPGSYRAYVRAYDVAGVAGPFSPGLNFLITSATADELVPETDDLELPQQFELKGESSFVRFEETNFDDVIEEQTVALNTVRQNHAQPVRQSPQPWTTAPSESDMVAVANLDSVWTEWPEQDLWDSAQTQVADDESQSEVQVASAAALIALGAHTLLRRKKAVRSVRPHKDV